MENKNIWENNLDKEISFWEHLISEDWFSQEILNSKKQSQVSTEKHSV